MLKTTLLKALLAGYALLLAGIVVIAMIFIGGMMPKIIPVMVSSMSANVVCRLVSLRVQQSWTVWVAGASAATAATILPHMSSPGADILSRLVGTPIDGLIGLWFARASEFTLRDDTAITQAHDGPYHAKGAG